MADKAWEVVKPAVKAALDRFEDEFADESTLSTPVENPERNDGALLAKRVAAALTGSDWRYVKKLGGTLEREF